jgi:hypothetical protein
MSARIGTAQSSHKLIHSADEIQWQTHANCHGRPDVEFFPPPNAGISAEVRRVCGSCPVRRDCLNFALKYGEWHGIWGGLTEKERRELAKKIVHNRAPCGTPAAFQRHIRKGEEPCTPCREAKNASVRDWRTANAQTLNERRLRARNAPSRMAVRA